MIELTDDNYFTYSYNNSRTQRIRLSRYDNWIPHFSKGISRTPLSLKQETKLACEMMYSTLGERPINLMFSGGVDSDCALRCFHELSIPVRPYLISHKYRPDNPELKFAYDLCNRLGIKPIEIELDLFRRFEDGSLLSTGKTFQTRMLSMIELILGILTIGEPCILVDDIRMELRSTDSNLVSRGYPMEWVYELDEEEDGVFDRLTKVSGLPVIANFYRYTPECWVSLIRAHQKLVKPSTITNSWQTKNIMMCREFGVPYRDKSSIFSTPPYSRMNSSLLDSLRFEIPLKNILAFPEKKLLETLGVGNE